MWEEENLVDYYDSAYYIIKEVEGGLTFKGIYSGKQKDKTSINLQIYFVRLYTICVCIYVSCM